MLHLPIKISDSPENLKTPQGLCTMLVYVEIGADPSRLPSFSSLAAADLLLCHGVSSVYIGGRMAEKTPLGIKNIKKAG
jgi:hypothetical protein